MAYLNQMMDPKLEAAFQEAEATNSVTPLIKQELQLTILHRRHISGQGEVEEEPKKVPVKRELTQAELEKKSRRKEQNRRAAERCRIKKKKMNDKLNLEFIEQQKRTQQLELEIQQLKEERDMLRLALTSHTCKSGQSMQSMLNEELAPMSWNSPPRPEMDSSCKTPSPVDEAMMVQQMNIPNPDIKSELETYPPCAAGLQYGEVQYGDPFDDAVMYPYCGNDDVKQCRQPFSPLDADPYTDALPDLDLLTEFVSEAMPPCSPSMMQGRVSISDYLDH